MMVKHYIHEGQAGFRKKRSCIDNVYTLKGRLREGKKTYAFFPWMSRKLMIQSGVMVCRGVAKGGFRRARLQGQTGCAIARQNNCYVHAVFLL